jgi:Trypsin
MAHAADPQTCTDSGLVSSSQESFGRVEKPTTILKHAWVPIASKQDCAASSPWLRDHGGLDFDHTLCSGGEGGAGICYGDSGG